MTSARTVCRKCEAEIFPDAPEGLCTACLFETGLNLLASDTQFACEGGSASPKTINAFGERVPPQKSERTSSKTPRLQRCSTAGRFADFGDYELLEVIGRGGQGWFIARGDDQSA